MIRSMTGFGAASAHADGADYHVELRAVNNRYFKTSLRLGDTLQPLEAEIEIALRKRLGRGTVTARVSVSESAERAALSVNHAALRRYVDQTLAAWPGGVDASPTFDIGSMLALPGVLQPPGDEDERLDRARRVVLPLIDLACDRLVEMRVREGHDLAADLLGQHAEIAARLGEIEHRAPDVARQYEQRLIARIESLVKETQASVDPSDLVREVAVHAERTDIHEEIKRLRTHLEQFELRLRQNGPGEAEPVGRTLEFLGQEMLREANTMASKSPDAEVSRLAVEIKSAIDRIKEQVQNVE